jgi:NitT/TauT family transport system ATP-binding protein
VTAPPQPPGLLQTQLPAAIARTRLLVHNLGKVFDGGVEALAGIDLEIPSGQFISIIGPSGCGKSTLLRIIAGLERQTSGRVDFPQTRPDHPAAAPRVAFVFQDAHLLPWRNVLNNVVLPLELLRWPRQQSFQSARAALEQVGLGDVLMRYPNQLSGGMKMRVSLARALVTDPELLLLDEPFAALDEITRQKLDEQLRQLWQGRKMTVIFVTHSIGEAAYLSQRTLVMSRRPGRIIMDHPIALLDDRPASLRGEPAFAREVGTLLAALGRGEQST